MLNFAASVLLFCVFQLFSTKNAENEDFDQRLGAHQPKAELSSRQQIQVFLAIELKSTCLVFKNHLNTLGMSECF